MVRAKFPKVKWLAGAQPGFPEAEPLTLALLKKTYTSLEMNPNTDYTFSLCVNCAFYALGTTVWPYQ